MKMESELVVIPIRFAYVCLDCDGIGSNARMCCQCSSTSLMGLAGVLGNIHKVATVAKVKEPEPDRPKESFYRPARHRKPVKEQDARKVIEIRLEAEAGSGVRGMGPLQPGEVATGEGRKRMIFPGNGLSKRLESTTSDSLSAKGDGKEGK